MASHATVAHLKSTKIAVVGAGSVGATTAYALLLRGLAAEIVLIDVDTKRVEGEAMDLSHAAHFSPSRIRAGGYDDCADAVAVIITAGRNQMPGESRMDLRQANYAVFADVVPRVARVAPDTIIIVATNPVDVLTHAAFRLSGFPPERVFGTGTSLDTARFRHELGRHFGVSPQSVHAVVVGEHGDTQLPLWSLATISGMHLSDYARQAALPYDEAALDACFIRTRQAAYDIIALKGKTNYGIASVLVSVIEPVIADGNAIMTVSRVGTHAGVEDVALGMPCKINRQGAHLGVPLLLDTAEEKALQKSAMAVKQMSAW